MNPFRHKIISAIFALAFVIMMQVMTSGEPVFRYLVPTFFGFLVAMTIYNWRYLLSIGGISFWILARVPVFVLIWFGLIFIVPFGFVRSLFLFASLPIIFVFETLVANKGQQLGWNLFLLSLG